VKRWEAGRDDEELVRTSGAVKIQNGKFGCSGISGASTIRSVTYTNAHLTWVSR